MNDEGRIQRLLACLGDPSRFKVLALLMERDCYVTEVAERVGLSQSCTTRHLQALLREGVVHRVRAGKRVMFRIADSDPQVSRLLEWAMLRAPGASGEAGVERRLAAAGEARGDAVADPPARAPAAARSRLPVGVLRRPLAADAPGAAAGRRRTASERVSPGERVGPGSGPGIENARQPMDSNASLPTNDPPAGAADPPTPDPSELEDYLL